MNSEMIAHVAYNFANRGFAIEMGKIVPVIAMRGSLHVSIFLAKAWGRKNLRDELGFPTIRKMATYISAKAPFFILMVTKDNRIYPVPIQGIEMLKAVLDMPRDDYSEVHGDPLCTTVWVDQFVSWLEKDENALGGEQPLSGGKIFQSLSGDSESEE